MPRVRKRKCILCNAGFVMTDVAKEKAICVGCASLMEDSAYDHTKCDCSCHISVSSSSLKFVTCAHVCKCFECKYCGDMVDAARYGWDTHYKVHKTLIEFQKG